MDRSLAEQMPEWLHRFVTHQARRYGFKLVPAAPGEIQSIAEPSPDAPGLPEVADQSATAPGSDLAPATNGAELVAQWETPILDVDTIVALAEVAAARLSEESAADEAYDSMSEIFEQGLPDVKVFNYAVPSGLQSVDPWTWIKSTLTIKTVIDIGANTGEYVEYLGSFFEPSALYAFEPLASCQPRLRELAEQFPHMQIFQLALDDHEGEETFWENEYGPSSSLLQVTDIHKEAFPHTERETATTVKVARLDDVLDVNALERGILIKIDVQGVEDRVIRGGQAIFSAADAVLIELSFMQLYDRQPIFDEVNDQLRGLGLRLVGVKNQIEDPTTGQPLFVHCIYRRDPPPPASSTP